MVPDKPISPIPLGPDGQRYGRLREGETGVLDDVVSWVGDRIIAAPGTLLDAIRPAQTVREHSSSAPVLPAPVVDPVPASIAGEPADDGPEPLPQVGVNVAPMWQRDP